MAFSLHRRKGSPYWHAWIRIPDPKDPERTRQTSKSTKQTKKADAEDKARELEKTAREEAGAGDERSAKIYAVLRKAQTS